MKTTSKIILAAAFAAVGATLAFAAPDDVIKARQDCMKAQGGAVFGVGMPMVKGEKPYDRAALDAGFAKMDAACANWSSFWAADAMTGTIKTRAKPEIWSDAAGFEAAGGAGYAAMTALRASTDEASFKAAFGAVGAACQGCHEKFRGPE